MYILNVDTRADLLVDFKVLGSVSPLARQNVTSRTGQRITDQEIPVTLHQVFCHLQQYRGLHVDTQTHTQTHCVPLQSEHYIQHSNSLLLYRSRLQELSSVWFAAVMKDLM